MRIPTLGIALLTCLAAASASAQDLRPESLKQYGGTFSPACGDPSAPRVRIAADGLEIAHGARKLRTRVTMDSYTSFGAAPTSPVPEGYRVEFIGDDFSLYVFEDAKGQFVPLQDYVPAAAPVVGAQAMKARFGRCP
ncbi:MULTISPECIES: hypothetical protein [unclassified Lysobacter]|uniref:hypothetical protein n=1 Tax=unclassified Lysobacter TaxID=2635362 RepID=UPI001C21F266|nr:hypothetical protein [Lysobacter sp. MMG2]MBU8975811.1 hypothetical protein [Lysobacter sp. MMG2]